MPTASLKISQFIHKEYSFEDTFPFFFPKELGNPAHEYEWLLSLVTNCNEIFNISKKERWRIVTPETSKILFEFYEEYIPKDQKYIYHRGVILTFREFKTYKIDKRRTMYYVNKT
jgi:hypothetical protein